MLSIEIINVWIETPLSVLVYYDAALCTFSKYKCPSYIIHNDLTSSVFAVIQLKTQHHNCSLQLLLISQLIV